MATKQIPIGTFYCLESPSGRIFTDTLAATKIGCWFSGGFDIVGYDCDSGADWRGKYWKKPEASMKSALRMGYKFRKLALVPV